MKNKKRLIILLSIFLPILFLSGVATWVILENTVFAPKYDPNGTSILQTLFDNQTTTYNASEQGPKSTDSSIIKDEDVEFSYRLTTETNSPYTKGLPVDAGDYHILVKDSTDKYIDAVVQYNIGKANMTYTGNINFVTMYEWETPVIATNTLSFKGVGNESSTEILCDDPTIANATYPLESKNTVETVEANAEFIPSLEIYKKNYNPCIIQVSISLEAVSYDKDTGYYYGTIQKALTTGTNIYVINGLSLTISSNIEIGNGKSLYLPHTDEYWDIASDDYIKNNSVKPFIDSSEENVNKNRNILLNMTNSADIIVNSGGKLYLGGEFGGIGISGKYSEINLDTSSCIENSGDFYCYGYVKENSSSYKNGLASENNSKYLNEYDSERYIANKNGGYIKTAIAIFDIKTGGALTTLNNNNICPLNEFEFPNMQTYVEFYYGCDVDVQARLLVGSGTMAVAVNSTINLVRSNTNEKALFYISSGSIGVECVSSNVLYTSKTSTLTRITINGQVTLGYLEIKVSTETVSTKTSFLPISYRMNIFVVEGAIFNSDYAVKFLPGSKLKIEKGTVNFNNKLIFYENNTFDALGQDVGVSYPDNKGDAKFINNGSLIFGSNGAIGGLIETEVTDASAIVDFTNITSSDNFIVSSPEGLTNVMIKISASGYFIENNIIDLYQFVPKSKITSDENGNKCWTGAKYKVYSLNINIEPTTYTYNVLSYQVFLADDINGTGSTELSSGTMSIESSYDIVNDKYIRIKATRYASAVFEDGTEFNSDKWYKVTKNINFNITPNEGVQVYVYTESQSGSAATTYSVTESSTSSSNDFTEIGTITMEGYAIVIKNYYFKVKGTFAPALSYNPMQSSGLEGATIQIGPSEYVNKTFNESNAYPASTNYKIYYTIKDVNTCITTSTLITLADGSQKKVEDLLGNEEIFVWNHSIGKLDKAKIAYIVNHNENPIEYTIITLRFSDKNNLGIIGEHVFYDVTLNKYITISENNVDEYIGHKFIATNGSAIYETTLIDYSKETKLEKAYEIVTYKHLTCFTDNILSASAYMDKLLNIFEIDEITYIYDEKQMQADIEKYGLFTYDDFKDLIPYEAFDLYNAQYAKIAVGKGYITWDDILWLIDIYYNVNVDPLS